MRSHVYAPVPSNHSSLNSRHVSISSPLAMRAMLSDARDVVDRHVAFRALHTGAPAYAVLSVFAIAYVPEIGVLERSASRQRSNCYLDVNL